MSFQSLVSSNCLPKEPRRIGSFSSRQFERAGIQGCAEKLAAGSLLTQGEAVLLAANASLGMLAKLIELCPGSCRSDEPQALQSPAAVRPVFFLPLAALIDELGPWKAITQGSQRLLHLGEEIELEQQLSLAVDCWQGRFELGVFLDILEELTQTHNLEPVHLSVAELVSMAGTEDDGTICYEKVEALLDVLAERGFLVIEGGANLRIQKRAAQMGFCLRVGQEIQPEDKSLERFVSQLFSMREAFCPSECWEVWFPWTKRALDRRLSVESALGVQLLRSISLARLLLPELESIRAPLSLLGVKVAHIATHFGANDLGFAAVDSGSEAALGIPKLSDLHEILGESSMVVRAVK